MVSNLNHSRGKRFPVLSDCPDLLWDTHSFLYHSVSVLYLNADIMEFGSIGPLATNTSEVETLQNVRIIAGNECYHTLGHIYIYIYT